MVLTQLQGNDRYGREFQKHNIGKIKKAGRSRWLGEGRRVRGVVYEPGKTIRWAAEKDALQRPSEDRAKVFLAKGYKTARRKILPDRYIVDVGKNSLSRKL